MDDSFYNIYPYNLDSFHPKKFKNKVNFSQQKRKALLDYFNHEKKEYTYSKEQLYNVKTIENKNTFTICSAHQPNFFSGFLYTIYKISHSIGVCQLLNKYYSEFYFIPIFYLGSEDHDINELNQIFLDKKKITFDEFQTNVPFGKQSLRGVKEFYQNNIEATLKKNDHFIELEEILERSYLVENTTAGEAFKKFLSFLFGKYGLLIIEPLSSSFKIYLKEYLKGDLFKNQTIKTITKTNRILESKGFHTQINISENNFFIIKNRLREKIEKQFHDVFTLSISGTKMSKSDIFSLILGPSIEQFSPNAVYRSLYQETILPNVAFIGGTGEISYWLQLKDLFDYYKLDYPILMLRNSFALLPNKFIDKLRKYQIDLRSTTSLTALQKILNSNKEVSYILRDETKTFQEVLDKILLKVKDYSPNNLLQTLSSKKKIENILYRLNQKLLMDNSIDNNQKYLTIKNVTQKLFPNDTLQERVENILPYYAKFGQNFIDEIIHNSKNIAPQYNLMSY